MSTNFKLWLDTQAPTLSAFTVTPTEGNTPSSSVSLTVTDPVTTQQLYMKVWASETASPAASSTEIPAQWETYNNSIQRSDWWTATSNVNKTYYFHAMFKDSVNNVSEIYTSSNTFHYTTVLPTVTIDTSVTSSLVVANADLKVKFTTTVTTASGGSYTLKKGSTTIANGSFTQSQGTSGITITKSGDARKLSVGTNTLTLEVTDAAGNKTTKTITVVYDSQVTTGALIFGKSASDHTQVSYSNASDSKIYLYLSTSSTDIASITFEVKCGTTQIVNSTTKNVSELTQVSGYGYYIGAYSPGIDGTYSFTGTYLDTAGQTGAFTGSQVIRDAVAPTVTITGFPTTWYTGDPDQSTGYSSPGMVTGTVTISDATSGIDTAPNWSITTSQSGVDLTSAFTLTGSGGSYTLTAVNKGLIAKNAATSVSAAGDLVFKVYDKAGNVQSVTAGLHKPTIDTTVPALDAAISDSTVVITGANLLASTTTPVKKFVVTDSQSGVDRVIIAWSQSSSTPTSWSLVTSTGTDYVTAINNNWSSTNANGTWYLHYRLIDIVDNKSTDMAFSFYYDTTAPTGTVAWAKSRTIATQNTVNFTCTDASTSISAPLYMKVTSNSLSDADTDWVAFTPQRTFTFKSTETAGTKTISVQYKDAVGNLSSVYSDTIIYDTDRATTATIMDSTGTTEQGIYTKVLPFAIRIGDSTDNVADYASYKIWGDFSKTSETTTVTPEPTTWTPFHADAGKNWMTVSGLYLSSGDGVKTIHVQVKTTDGDEYAEVTDTITLDRTPPQINVSAVSNNLISVLHETRPSVGSLTGVAVYSDVVTFNFTYNEQLLEYKVCVLDVAKKDDPAQQTAIGTTHGSVNMSGSTSSVSGTVSCTLYGKDFQAHPIVNNTDGAYIIAVYGKDLAGVWSLIGEIAT